MSALREELRRAFVDALGAVRLAPRVRGAVAPFAAGASRVRVVAMGKAAAAMMEGALAAAARARVDGALAIVPDGTDVSALPRGVTVLRAAHPVPDARSEHAAARALACARGMAASDVFVALVSGGASTLVCAPRGVSREEKAELVRALFAVGAPIQDINVVRRHLSWIKGGGLARAAAPATVVAVIASDVIGGAPHDVASGPAVYDPSTREDASAVVARWLPRGGGAPLPAAASCAAPWPPFSSTLAPFEPAARRVRVRVVASPGDLAAAVAARLAARLLPPAGGDVARFVAEYAGLARTLAPGEVVVRAAEPTLAVPRSTSGRGGRSGHLAAALAPHLPPGVAFLAGASDGIDGTSGAAGAVVDASFVAAVTPERLASALAAYDTASLHEAAGTRIALGPTGTNLADVHIVARGD